jgi:hypothetical protein
VILALLLACKAETLGIEVPRGGPDAISMEDLQRDTFLLSEAPDAGGQLAALERRFTEMHTLPGFDRSYQRAEAEGVSLCAMKEGKSGKTVYVQAEAGTGPAAAARLAALISLAKAFDLPSPPPHSLLLCARAPGPPPLPESSLAAHLSLGPMTGPTLSIAPPGDAATVRIIEAIPQKGEDSLATIDFRLLLRHVIALYGVVSDPTRR